MIKDESKHFIDVDYFWDNRVGTIKSDSVELLPQTGAEIIASGSCGEHLTWTLNKKGTLTISGYGAMSDFSASNRTPWSSYAKQDIKQIIIDSGATSIGSYAFSRCWELISVDIPNTVESIGRDAFADCFELKKITIPMIFYRQLQYTLILWIFRITQ